MDRIFNFKPETWRKYSKELMDIERSCFRPEIQEDVARKRALMTRNDGVVLLYEKDGQNIIGECYGFPTDNCEDVHDIENYERFGKGNSFYAYSEAILPKHQNKKNATRLMRSFVGNVKNKNFDYISGHAKEGAMVKILTNMGGSVLRKYENWYNTGNNHYLMEGNIKNMDVVEPIKQENEYFCGPASLKASFNLLNGSDISQTELSKLAKTTEEDGTSKENMVKTSKDLGYKSDIIRNASFSDIMQLKKDGASVIVDWFDTDTSHYSVVDTIDDKNICIMDPYEASYKIYAHDEFDKVWFSFFDDKISADNFERRECISIHK